MSPNPDGIETFRSILKASKEIEMLKRGQASSQTLKKEPIYIDPNTAVDLLVLAQQKSLASKDTLGNTVTSDTNTQEKLQERIKSRNDRKKLRAKTGSRGR